MKALVKGALQLKEKDLKAPAREGVKDHLSTKEAESVFSYNLTPIAHAQYFYPINS